MSTSTPPDVLANHEARVAEELSQQDAELAAQFRAQLPGARRSVLNRLVSALVRERLLSSDRLKPTVRQVTATGRLVADGPVVFEDRTVEDPVDLLRLIAEHGLGTGAPGEWLRVAEEIGHSVTGQALAMVAAEHRRRPSEVDAPFSALDAALRAAGGHGCLAVAFEQLVVDGHPMHPGAKIKIGMSAVDAVRYGPEFGVSFDLGLIAVRQDCAVGSPVARAVLREAFPRAVTEAEAELRAAGHDPDGYVFVPIHPHQREHALPQLHSDALADGTVLPLRARIPAEPLMSVRTLAVREPGSPVGLHVKTALEVRVTGAVRGVSQAAIHNGPKVSELVERIAAGDLDLSRTTQDGRRRFAICRELAGVGYVPPEARGEGWDTGDSEKALARQRSLCSVLREDVAAGVAPGELAMPVAALLATSPVTGNSVVADLLTELHGEVGGTLDEVAQEWLGQHVELCVPAALTLLVRYGIALEPHPQNAVLVLADKRPQRVLVRDLGGARLLPQRLARRGFEIELLPGSALLAEDPELLRAKLFFPLFGNHLGELIAAVAEGTGCPEDQLWAVVRRCVLRTFTRLTAAAVSQDEVDDARADAEALLHKPWRYKTMLAMRLASLVTDQRYVDAPNPLRDSEPPAMPEDLSLPEEQMYHQLRESDPELLRDWLTELPGARLSTVYRALGAMEREDVVGTNRPVHTIDELVDLVHPAQVRADLADSARNLALSRAGVARRRRRLSADQSVSDLILDLDAMCAEGHLLHPFGRSRGEFTPADSLAYAAETADTVGVQLVAVRRELTMLTPDESGRSVGDLIAEHYPEVAARARAGLERRGHDPGRYELVPVHPWQAARALPREYAAELASGEVVPIPEAQLACRPTVSLRSLVTAAPGRHGRRLTVKTALDVLITSTRRTISPASTRNGPAQSALLTRLVGNNDRVRVVAELAGVAFAGAADTPGRKRGLSALLREDPADQVGRGEWAFSACALRATSPATGRPLLADLLETQSPQEFLTEYADLLFSATLPLMWRHGIALEAHLQNTVLVVREGRPVRLLLRDFSGMRGHRERMRLSGAEFTPHEGSVTITEDLAEVRAKLAHAVVLANLADVVDLLTTVAEVRAESLWGLVREVLRRVHEGIDSPWAEEEYAALLAPTLSQKALARMRMAPVDGVVHCPRPNPLLS
ncbi:hypothetical protein GCM10010174_00400 [Kutzneria viridogrisea]|uniref:Siderophore synthetase component n=1 Tax=Kutzneria viridogrisea TaxID=47990 RepID=A0ABR6BCF7_9PSEU|nr:siderophore synthetase component [Kutzneria viridogrisea]